jgi:integrase
MGTVKPYQTKTKGKLWEVWYAKPNSTKRGHVRGFQRKMDAEAYLATVEVSKHKGSYIDRADARATIDQLGPEWLERHKPRVTASSFHSIESSWRVHVQPKWGSYPVGRIVKRDVEAWLAGLTITKGKNDDGSPRTLPASHTVVARARDTLAAILDDAIEDNRINANPARTVSIKKKPIPDEVFLTHRQVEDFALVSKYPDLVRFLAYTGLRWGEATALRVRNVDLVRRRITVREAVAEVNGKPVLGGVKSHEKRTTAYPRFLDDEIAAACSGKSGEDRLWSSEDGGFLRPGNSVSGWFVGAVKRAMKADPQFRRVTPHDLRHTAAGLAISAGANVKVVQRMLGHKNAAETLNTYAALFPDDFDNVTDALSRQRDEQL